MEMEPGIKVNNTLFFYIVIVLSNILFYKLSMND